MGSDPVDHLQVVAGHLDPDGTLDAGGQHVNPVADGWNPDVGQARNLDGLVQLLDQTLGRHSWTPLVSGLELHRGLEHFQRCRIGCGLRAASLAEDALDLGNRLDHPVAQLQKLRRPLCRQARERRRHVQQIAFVQPGQELAPQPREGPDRGRQRQHGDDQCGFGAVQNPFQARPVHGNQRARDRVFLLVRDTPSDPVAHEDGDQRDRESRCCGHRIGLGERQRSEQATFLCFQREDRHEGQGDDQQREEQRGAHLHGGFGDHLPALFPDQLPVGMLVLPGLQLLVGVLNHHHGCIDHGAHGDGNPAQGHDVSVDALVAHHQKRRHDPQRQRNDGDQCRA